MYVRWKKRKSTDTRPDHQRWKANEITYSAELVENKRIDGKPRQTVLAFLGSIRQSELNGVNSRMHRYYFWYRIMTRKMKQYPLYRLTEEQQRTIFKALHKIVPLSNEEFQVELERTRSKIGEWNMPPM